MHTRWVPFSTTTVHIRRFPQHSSTSVRLVTTGRSASSLPGWQRQNRLFLEARLDAPNPQPVEWFRECLFEQTRQISRAITSLFADAMQDAVEQLKAQVHLVLGDMEARRQRNDVLVVATDIEHEAILLAVDLQIALQPLVDHAVDDRLRWREAVVRLADLHAQCHSQAVHVADDRVAALKLFQPFEQIGALVHDHHLVVGLGHHLHGFERHGGAHGVGAECGMGGAGREDLRVDELFACPDAGQRIEAVGKRLAEHDDVRRDAEMLDREELAGAVEAHLNLVHHQQDAVLVEHALQPGKVVLRRDDVAPGTLDRLHVERGVFRLAGLGVPHAVVLALEQALELFDAVVTVFLLGHALGAAEMVGERHELGAISEVAVAPAIAVGGGDGGGAERAAVIAALEGEHQALAVLGIAHELQAVLDRLAASDIEVDAALQPEPLLGQLRQHGGKLDLLTVQVLARQLRQPVELAPHHLVQTGIAIAEIDSRIPHLQIEVRAALRIVEKGALAALEDLRRIGVVHGVAVRAIPGLEVQKLPFRRLAVHVVDPGGMARWPHQELVHVSWLFFPQSSALCACWPRSVVMRPSSQPARISVASPKSANATWGRSFSMQWSSRTPLARTRSARPAMQKSERPSPPTIDNSRGASATKLHLQVPDRDWQSLRACGKVRRQRSSPHHSRWLA